MNSSSQSMSSLSSIETIRESFQKRFPDIKSSVEFLFNIRWPEGFQCPCCLRKQPDVLPAQTVTCSGCGQRTSLSSKTIMHGTKKSLKEWLCAIWWFCDNSSDASAKNLQRLLYLPSYQTAWTWLQKLRMAMGIADNKLCKGFVEIACHHVSPAFERQQKGLVICAAEVILKSGITGLIRMQSIQELSATSITDFLQLHVRPGSSIVTTQLDVYRNIKQSDYTCVINSLDTNPFRPYELINSFEIWLNRVHRGGVTLKHLQLYIDEFCFRHNSNMLADKEAVFKLLLSGVMSIKPKSYRELVS